MRDTSLTKWIPAFIFGVLMIVVYKTIDNIDLVMGAIGSFIKIISPFLVSILIVYFLYVPCKKFEDLYKKSKAEFIKKRARSFGVITVYLLLLFIIVLVIIFIIPIIIQSLLDLAGNIPTYTNYIFDKIDRLPDDFIVNKETLMDAINSIFNNLFNPSRIEQLTKGIMVVANGVVNIVISLTVSLYILLDRDNLAKSFNNMATVLLPENKKNIMYKYIHQVNDVIFTFIASKGLDSIINLVAVTTILMLLGVKYALLLGVLAAIASFIPYLGSLVAVIIISIITIITGGINQAILVAALLTVFQQIDGNFIEPRIMSNALKMSPILVIFAVIVGGAYFGIAGMFLAVPIAAISKQILAEYIASKKSDERQPQTEGV